MTPTNPTHRDEPFSVEAFLEFCRSKPADEGYVPHLPSGCALAAFGFPGVVDPKEAGVPRFVYSAALNCVADTPRATFGALAGRLEKALAEQVSL